MGTHFGATCRTCGHEYGVDLGGGFTFHLLRCDQCGKTKDISFEELGDTHKRYIKGLKVPRSGFTAEEDRRIQKEFKGRPLSEAKYHAAVEAFAGVCECGGQLRFHAPVRCPVCHSTEHTEAPNADHICYD